MPQRNTEAPVAGSQQPRRKLATPADRAMTRAAGVHTVLPRNQGLNGLVRGGFGPALLWRGEESARAGASQGGRRSQDRLTGARTETSGHLSFGDLPGRIAKAAGRRLDRPPQWFDTPARRAGRGICGHCLARCSASRPSPAPPAGASRRRTTRRRPRRPRRARANLSAYFSADDYPAAALRGNHQGTTGFRLTIAPNGRVTNCAVTASSGSAALDQATCRILRSRARYTPARGRGGTAIGGIDTGRVTWRLPTD
jgi:TonB family protein